MENEIIYRYCKYGRDPGDSFLGVVSGVTTNPSLVAKEGRDFREVLKEMALDGPISAEVMDDRK